MVHLNYMMLLCRGLFSDSPVTFMSYLPVLTPSSKEELWTQPPAVNDTDQHKTDESSYLFMFCFSPLCPAWPLLTGRAPSRPPSWPYQSRCVGAARKCWHQRPVSYAPTHGVYMFLSYKKSNGQKEDLPATLIMCVCLCTEGACTTHSVQLHVHIGMKENKKYYTALRSKYS